MDNLLSALPSYYGFGGWNFPAPPTYALRNTLDPLAVVRPYWAP